MQRIIKTIATASPTSLPIVPKSAPLCISHTVRRSDTLPSWLVPARSCICRKGLQILGDSQRWLRDATTTESPREVTSTNRVSRPSRSTVCQVLFSRWNSWKLPTAHISPERVRVMALMLRNSTPEGIPLLKSLILTPSLSVRKNPFSPYIIILSPFASVPRISP